MKKFLFTAVLAVLCSAPVDMGARMKNFDIEATERSVVAEQTKNDSARLYAEKTKATYYHDKFEGRITASGKKFSQRKLTVAHNQLPFGTTLKVTNLKNGKSVVVVVTDRGKLGRNVTLDLSKEAFKKIGDLDTGVIHVKVEILKQNIL